MAFLFVLNPYRNRALDGEYLTSFPFFICGFPLFYHNPQGTTTVKLNFICG
ncbi:hypothetical protein SSUR61_0998 [Streptococcus suis R61]|uniref:Uncharacterized protein n=1 Tax=Streptococcus suis R61 TaxID=996306 RepID=A0AA87K3U2_STRSU|nr:hypothetical protein SSUR61_0998 [Streptococcus suis R61]